MFKKLQQYWGVSGWRFFLILCTFAVTGTFTAWVSRHITDWLDTEKYSLAWWLLKIGVLLIGYQIFILIFGFCFGQFAFFWKFEKKILRRLGLMKKEKKTFTLAIFASGAGSNTKQIIEDFAGSPDIRIGLIACNKEGAGVLEIAKQHNIQSLLINRDDKDGVRILAILKEKNIDLIVLAGYLWKLPPLLVKAFQGRIINIHPALLPKYGGKGMYGNFVHEAVIRNRETESGITIHYVDEIYDNGEIIFRQSCPVDNNDTPASLAQKIHRMEHEHYSKVIRSVLEKQNHS